VKNGVTDVANGATNAKNGTNIVTISTAGGGSVLAECR
jgi:hypothetical protein